MAFRYCLILVFSIWTAQAVLAQTNCESGFAGSYPCNNIDLMALMTPDQLGGTAGMDVNDLWGWTDPVTGTEYALVGIYNGTAFVDITDPVNPVLVGHLPTLSVNSDWRDIKVYKDHAFIISEAFNHGLQVFDLRQLRNVASPPTAFTTTASLTTFGDAHNIAVNEETGFAYVVGANTCSGGLYMVDIRTPSSPTYAGCFSDDGYTHDAQCVIYHGADPDYVGKEICFASNTDTVTIVDVSNKSTPVMVSRTGYAQVGYTHQGWLSEDHRLFFMNDEFDESNYTIPTRTYIVDLSDLDNPVIEDWYSSSAASTDHNLFIRDGYLFEANYRSGLHILDGRNIDCDQPNCNITEVGFFDTVPGSDTPGFGAGPLGLWSNYPFFCSGTLIASDIEQGLFIFRSPVLQSTICTSPKVYLQGSYDPPSGLMTTGLNAGGWLPIAQPYSSEPWLYGGTESVPNSDVLIPNGKPDFFDLHPEIVDWVLVSLRSGTAKNSTVVTKAGFLRNDGSIVAPDGRSLIKFSGIATGDYYLVVEHRNHLAAMSAARITLSGSSPQYDFTVAATQAFGGDLSDVSAGTNKMPDAGPYALYAGDATGDGQVVYIGSLRDQLPIVNVLGLDHLAEIVTGYYHADMNLDGQVQYIGADRDQIEIITTLTTSNLADIKQTGVPK